MLPCRLTCARLSAVLALNRCPGPSPPPRSRLVGQERICRSIVRSVALSTGETLKKRNWRSACKDDGHWSLPRLSCTRLGLVANPYRCPFPPLFRLCASRRSCPFLPPDACSEKDIWTVCGEGMVRKE